MGCGRGGASCTESEWAEQRRDEEEEEKDGDEAARNSGLGCCGSVSRTDGFCVCVCVFCTTENPFVPRR